MHKTLFDVGQLPTQELETLSAGLTTSQAKLRAIAKLHDYAAAESSISLPDDPTVLSAVNEIVSRFDTKALKYIVVVGIGGSNLGSKAIYDAMFGAFDALNADRFPKLLFAETTSSAWLANFSTTVSKFTSANEIAICFISKSGTTTETVANFEVVTALVGAKVGDVAQRTIAITDEGSQLWNAAEVHGWHRISLPQSVGGRYSMFSPVGLVPLALAGFNIEELRTGATEARDAALGDGSETVQAAALLAYAAKNGRPIHDMFVFNPELESVGKWYRQLMGESLGKKVDRAGAEVWTGSTPTVSIGSTDLHSVGQLYFEGPRDKVTTFVLADQMPNAPIPAQRAVPELVEMINGKSIEQIQRAIFDAVTAAYHSNGMPFRAIELPNTSERSLGALLQSFMIEIMLAAELLNVNAFDQPGVEAYKVEMKRILQG